MDMFNTFEEYLSQSQAHISVVSFVINLLLTGALSIVLRTVYTHYGYTLSNRKIFGKNLMLISMTTMLIITIVKSSLALSLGLVGALSIIRFRSAIKEPEELAYLFLAISIGLGFGANQGSITAIALLIILSLIIITKKISLRSEDSTVMNFIVVGTKPSTINIDTITKILKNYCSEIVIKRLDESKESFEATFQADFNTYENLTKAKEEMFRKDENISITYLDRSNIFVG